MARIAIHSEGGKLTIAVSRKFKVVPFFAFPILAAACIPFALDAGKHSIVLRVCAAAVAAFFCFEWVARLTRREVLEFTPTALTYRAGPFGIARRMKFEMAKIREPRFVEPRPGRAGLPTGLELFYERVAFQVCDWISEAQAKEIIAAVARQFPELAPVWGTLHGYWSGDNAGADFRETK